MQEEISNAVNPIYCELVSGASYLNIIKEMMMVGIIHASKGKRYLNFIG